MQLILLRHAKAQKARWDVPDRHRPLQFRGRFGAVHPFAHANYWSSNRRPKMSQAPIGALNNPGLQTKKTLGKPGR